jgi:hypothetical protein
MITTQGAIKRTFAAGAMSIVVGPVVQTHTMIQGRLINESPRPPLLGARQSRAVLFDQSPKIKDASQAETLTPDVDYSQEVTTAAPRSLRMIETGKHAAAFALLGSVASGVILPWLPPLDNLTVRLIVVVLTMTIGFIVLARANARVA